MSDTFGQTSSRRTEKIHLYPCSQIVCFTVNIIIPCYSRKLKSLASSWCNVYKCASKITQVDKRNRSILKCGYQNVM